MRKEKRKKVNTSNQSSLCNVTNSNVEAIISLNLENENATSSTWQ